jgi:hypothetical protein
MITFSPVTLQVIYCSVVVIIVYCLSVETLVLTRKERAVKRGHVTGMKRERQARQSTIDRYKAICEAIAAELARKYPEAKK